MNSPRKQRWQQLQAAFEPGFKKMLVVSLLLHLLVPILYYSPFFSKKAVKKPPVYRVNLVNKIVKNPQAGRPEATVKKKKPQTKKKIKAKPKPKPAVKPKPIPVKPKSKPKSKPKVVKPKVKPKPKPKPVVKPKPVKPKVSKAQENNLAETLKKMRAEKERKAAEQARKAKLEALKAAAVAESSKGSPITDAPVGMVDGKGHEAGVRAIAFVQEFIRQQWSFSKYQAVGNPEAEMKLFYNKEGKLLHYRFVKKSGNAIFDESLTRAIAKSRYLGQPLPEAMEFDILFNLKDMLDKP